MWPYIGEEHNGVAGDSTMTRVGRELRVFRCVAIVRGAEAGHMYYQVVCSGSDAECRGAQGSGRV